MLDLDWESDRTFLIATGNAVVRYRIKMGAIVQVRSWTLSDATGVVQDKRGFWAWGSDESGYVVWRVSGTKIRRYNLGELTSPISDIKLLDRTPFLLLFDGSVLDLNGWRVNAAADSHAEKAVAFCMASAGRSYQIVVLTTSSVGIRVYLGEGMDLPGR